MTTTTDRPCFRTTVDQHKGDHEATGLRITGFTDVVTDFGDHFPGIDWDGLSDADREEYTRELGEIHEAMIALESLDADAREAAKEHLATTSTDDPWNSARFIRDAIESVQD
jgi:hypothetical protein